MYLNGHTYYSFRYGTFSEEELLSIAHMHGIKKIALTDINNTSACLNFIRLAPKYDIEPVVGIDFRNGADQQFVGIAKNNHGFKQLNALLSHYLHTKDPIPNEASFIEDAIIIYPFAKAQNLKLKDLQDYEYIGVSKKDLHKLPFSIFSNRKDKLICLNTISFRNKTDFNAHRLLRAIDNNVLLSKLSTSEEGKEEDVFMAPTILKQYYEGHDYILKNTKNLLEDCSIHFDFSESRKPQNLSIYTKSRNEDQTLLQELCLKNLNYRYGHEPGQKIRTRLNQELDLIQNMDFVSYFLINWDIIQYAKKQGYFYVGRGSGANSIVAYLLGITDVDPIDLDLYFERFINLYRKNPPDFDIDFSWRDREDVTQYIFNRFPNTALLGTYNTFQFKAVVRELGKVFGLPKDEIDVLSEGRFQKNRLDHISSLVIKYGHLIKGIPNYLSIHAGGVLIAERPIHCFTATNLPPKGFPTTQFDMHIAEDVGLYKFDILGQRGLAKIKESITIIRENQPEKADFDIHNISKFKMDPNINNLIKEANCLGCFYVESPAMRMLLKKLEVDNYLGLVAASSIIRPGVAKSGMMREYILRHRNPQRVKEQAHPIMLEIMPETYGVMVYQEDVIKVAHYFAGLTLGEADVIRRGMSGKYRSREEFQMVQDKFFANCKEKGYDPTVTKEIWRQIESFAGYAFAKGHSASYAVESYQTLFLKAYFPFEYIVAILNNGGGFYSKEVYIHEAKMLGAKVHAPDINNSYAHHYISGKDIYLGFGVIKDLEDQTIEDIIKARAKNPFLDLSDFLDRVSISVEQISILIRINAFRFTGQPKRKLLWEARFMLNRSTKKSMDQLPLFKSEQRKIELPQLEVNTLEDVFDEIELLGFPLENPFILLKEKSQNVVLSKEIQQHKNKTITMMGYLIALKNTSTSNGQRMNFGTFIDEAGQFIDTVHFPNTAKTYPFRGKGIYQLQGKVVEEFGFLTLEVEHMLKMDYVQDPRYAI